jgi:hypothetical protein
LLSDDYHRIGLIVGSLFSVCPVLVGIFVASNERSLLPLIFAGLTGTVMFLLAYGVGRLLGWILDGLVSRVEERT